MNNEGLDHEECQLCNDITSVMKKIGLKKIQEFPIPNRKFVYNKRNINPSTRIEESLDINIQWTDKINEVYTITIVYKGPKTKWTDGINLLYDPDCLDEKAIWTITGFKIVNAINNQLIIEPIGDKQKIVIEDKINNNTSTTNFIKKLDKSQQYSLPLDNKPFNELFFMNHPFMEYKKSLLGLGCITGDEKSCCGCCYWQ